VVRRTTDTREEIRAVALELFAANGFDKTSLREIAERLEITKAALYYHFPSKDELLAELAQPLVEGLREFYGVAREAGPGDARILMERYLELCYRNRMLFQSLLRDPSAVAKLGGLTALMHRRMELDRALVGSDDPTDRVRAVIAFGGLQDCVLFMGDLPLESYAAAAVDTAMRALQPG
jgi:AcrR family transcriptional regulator